MSRIYKPVGPSSNKAEAGPSSNKSAAPVQETKTAESAKKKGNSGEE